MLEKIFYLAKDTSGTEYLTFYIEKYQNQFNTSSLPLPKNLKSKIRLTIDTKNDFKNVKKFLEEMKNKDRLFDYNLKDIINFSKKNKIFSNKTKKQKIEIVDTEFNWRKISL